MKKLLGLAFILILVLALLPATVSATEAEEAGEYVYLSVSFDGQYIDDKSGSPMTYVPISLADVAAVDLAEYGLDNMLFDADGDGQYETTALQLIIYAHENLYGGDWSDVNFSAYPGSSYFYGGIFGFTENLVYFHNGDFPVDPSMESSYMTVGATSDRIVLEPGDFLDIASFSCYSFLWDTAGGFHLFSDPEGNYVHDYTVNAGEALPVKLMHSFCDLMYGQAWVYDATGYEVFYGSIFGEAEGSVFTDDSGCAEITFPDAGTYYVWCDGANSDDESTHGACDYYWETGEPCIVSAPAYAKVTVTGDAPQVQNAIIRQPQAVTATSGDTVQFQVEATGDVVSYKWEYRKIWKWFDTTMEGNDTDTLTVPVTGSRNGYDYRCTVTFADGTVMVSDIAELTAVTQITNVVGPNDQTVVLGYKGQFTVSAQGEGLKYQWQYKRPDGEKWSETAMEGYNKPTVMIETTAARDGYQYRCRITDVTGNEVYTEPATMRVLSFKAHPQNASAAVGGTATFTVATSVEDGFTYQWQYSRDGEKWMNTTMAGYDTDTLTVNVTKSRNGYQYRCVLTGSKNSKIESRAATLSVS